MRKVKTSIILLVILNLGLLCVNQNSDAAQNKSTEPVKSTSTPSEKSSSAGEKDTDQTEMDKAVVALQDGDIAKVQNAITAAPGIVTNKDTYGRDLLYYAIIYDQKDITELLLHKGSNIKDTDANGEPILFLPIYGPSSSDMNNMIKLLVANGADVKQTDKRKRSILHRIPEMRISANTISMLITNGDVNAKDNGGSTPLHIIAESKGVYKGGRSGVDNIDVAKMLLASGANINAKDREASTPLHRATAGNNKDMVIFLVEQKAALNAKDIKGNTPYSIATTNQYSEIVKYLEGKGAKKDESKNEKKTAKKGKK